MKIFTLLLVFALLTLTLPTTTTAKHLDGVINTGKDFVFLTRFVFQPNEYGQMTYTFTYPATECCYQMLIFNDEPGQWPYMREHEDQLNCFQRKDLIPSNDNGKVTLSTSQNCEIRINNDTGQEEFYCHGTRDFDVIDERWWYIAIAHCGGDGIINFKYNINMTNGKTAFDTHFSADERYILQTDIAFLGLYIMICGCLLKFRNLMIEQRMLNVTYRLFSYSCYLQTISLLFQTIAYGKYAYDGTGVERLRKFGEMISSTSTLLFVLLLILVAKGYTVTRARLRPVTSLKIGVFTCCYFFVYFGLYTLQELLYDPRDVVNKYDSFAGLGLVIMHIVGLFWMYYACFFTTKHNHSKAMFYFLFIIIFTTWFIATPVTIWMSTEFIAKWQRAKIVNGMELFTIFYGHMVFLLLTRPAANNRYFPFHLKTNTVGVINDVDNYDEENPPPPPPPSDFSSLFSATKAKYLTESKTSISLSQVPSDGRLSTISQTIQMTNPTNPTDNTPDAALPSSPPSGDVVKLSLPAAEASILPRGRFILVKAYVEE